MKEKCCGNCKYSERDWTNPNNPDFYCSNEDSWSYGYNTEYMHSCEDFEEKEKIGMREILFRAKRKDNGEWVEGHYGEYYSGKENVSCISIPKETISGSLCYDVIPETVGQYTGLTDKNGKKVFEGDILKGLYSNGNAEVKMINGSWVGYAGKGWTDIGYVVERVEIIGNVHDTPELLNE